MGWLQKVNIQINHERHWSVSIENKKQYDRKIEDKTNEKRIAQNRIQSLWQNSKKSAEWNGICIEKIWTKTSTDTRTKENEVQMGLRETIMVCIHWIKMVLNDESKILID